MSECYIDPRGTVSFGDIFDLAFLHDVHVRHDAVTLGSRTLSAKHGGGPSYADVFENHRWVLSHGTGSWAVLITDNCAVDTALGQDRDGGQPNGRLLFAPVQEISADQLPLKTWGRFALPKWDGVWESGVADLRRCFMVDSRDIAVNRDTRKASLDLETAEALEIRWSAYASRRGPLVAGRNSEKLAEVLMRLHSDGDLGEDDVAIARAVASTLAIAWRLEGRALEAIADAHQQVERGESEAIEVEHVLRELAEAAMSAADHLGTRLQSVHD